MKVMIVDDEPLILNGLVKIISGHPQVGNLFCCATNGVEALLKAETFAPDVVLTDVCMPGMDGFEMIREMRQRNICSRFIILSGHADFEYARQAIHSKAVDYLLKPVDKTRLTHLLTAVSMEAEVDLRKSGRQPEQDCAPGNSDNVKKMTAFISTHFNEDISLDALADRFGLHPGYVSTLFRKEIGTPFLQYLHIVRINAAKQMLSEAQDDPLERIARKVGYEHLNHFFKVFKKYCGVTPGEFRLQVRNGRMTEAK